MHTSCNKSQIRMCQDLVKPANTYSQIRWEYNLELIRRFNLSQKNTIWLFGILIWRLPEFISSIIPLCLHSLRNIKQVISLRMSSSGVYFDTYYTKSHYFWHYPKEPHSEFPLNSKKTKMFIHQWLKQNFLKSPGVTLPDEGRERALWWRAHTPSPTDFLSLLQHLPIVKWERQVHLLHRVALKISWVNHLKCCLPHSKCQL